MAEVERHALAVSIDEPPLDFLIQRLRHMARLYAPDEAMICLEAADHLERLQMRSAARLKIINDKLTEIDRLRLMVAGASPVSRPDRGTASE